MQSDAEEMTVNMIGLVSKEKTKNLSKKLYEDIFFAANYLVNGWKYIEKKLTLVYPSLILALNEDRVSYDVVVRLVTDLSKDGTRGKEDAKIRRVVEHILVNLGKYSKEVERLDRLESYYILTKEGYNFIEGSLFRGGCMISNGLGQDWFSAHSTPVAGLGIDNTTPSLDSIYSCMLNVKGKSFEKIIDKRTGMLLSAEFIVKPKSSGPETQFMVLDGKIKATYAEDEPDKVTLWFNLSDFAEWFGYKVVASIWEASTHQITRADWEIPVIYKEGQLQIPKIIRKEEVKKQFMECVERYQKDGQIFLPWGCFEIDLDKIVENDVNPPHIIGRRINIQ